RSQVSQHVLAEIQNVQLQFRSRAAKLLHRLTIEAIAAEAEMRQPTRTVGTKQSAKPVSSHIVPVQDQSTQLRHSRPGHQRFETRRVKDGILVVAPRFG